MPLTVDASISSIAPELRCDSSRLELDCYVSADTQYRALSRRLKAGTQRAVPHASGKTCGGGRLRSLRVQGEPCDMTRPVARVPRQDLAAPQYQARGFELGRARARRDSGVPWRYRWRSGRRTPRGVANPREPPGEDCDSIRDTVFAAAKTVENCLASVRKRHQLSVSQLMIEIRMLRKRIDRMESGASVVMLTLLVPRKGMEQRIREGNRPANCC